MEELPLVEVSGNLVLSLSGDIDDDSVLKLEERLTSAIGRRKARGVVIDVTGLAFVDSFIARALHRMAQLVRLMGADTVVVGIQPAVAITLVELGLAMDQLVTARDASHGFELLARMRGSDRGPFRAFG